MLRPQSGDQRVKRKPCAGEQRHDANHPFDVEVLGKKGEDQVDRKLCGEVHQYQRTQQGVGDAVHITQGDEENGRQTEDGGHGEIGGVAGKLRPLEIRRGHGDLLCYVVFQLYKYRIRLSSYLTAKYRKCGENYLYKIPKKVYTNTVFFVQRFDLVITNKNEVILYLEEAVKSERYFLYKKGGRNFYFLPLGSVKDLHVGDILMNYKK